MAERNYYYAIVDDYTSREEPAGVLRRVTRTPEARGTSPSARDLRVEVLLFTAARSSSAATPSIT